MEKYCLIGKSLKHTISPQIHHEFGLIYDAVELCDEIALKTFVEAKEYKGFNVTIPYKQTIMKYLDEIDDTAQEIGAVNTVVNRSGKLVGYNTDIDGLNCALTSANINLFDKNIMILGNGGASKTVQFFARKENAKNIIVVARNTDINFENCYQFQNTQIIINATPVGMMPNEEARPVDISKFKNVESVFDLIYNPLCTRLLFDAREKKIKYSNGLILLVEQARIAHDLFISQNTAAKITQDLAKKLELEMSNIVLVGMAGSGKSTVGRMIAKILEREFVDTDILIEQSAGKSIPQIFEEYGENYFRELESDVILNASKKKGLVIATGGGAVLNKKNRERLKANGIIFNITRDLSKLATAGRPLSKNKEEVHKLWNERKSVYEDFADFEIDNNESIENAVVKILQIL